MPTVFERPVVIFTHYFLDFHISVLSYVIYHTNNTTQLNYLDNHFENTLRGYFPWHGSAKIQR